MNIKKTLIEQTHESWEDDDDDDDGVSIGKNQGECLKQPHE